jgi:hypothetical protein
MRLKERRDNWRSHAIIKRDFKHDHSESIPKFRSHKNTLKWCKGKIGFRHEIHWHKETWFFGITTYVGKCVNCSKTIYKSRLPKA